MLSMDELADMVLGRFVGVDEVSGSQWAERETAAVLVTAEREMGGAIMTMRITETRQAGPFEAVNVFMPDRDSGDLLLYGFDSFGYPPDPPARGRIENGRIELLRATARGESRTTFETTASGFRWAKDFRPSAGCSWQAVVTGSLDRASD